MALPLLNRTLSATLILAALACASFGGFFPADGHPNPDDRAAMLRPETDKAFERYAVLTEARIQSDLSPGHPFLTPDALPPNERAEAFAALRRGEIRIEKLETLDAGRVIKCPDGLIHHWAAIIFIPGATLDGTLKLLQNYDRQSIVYAPDVAKSRTISHSGDDFHIFLRFRRKKFITVVLDTEHDVHYTRIDATRAASRSVSIRVSEVADAGTPREHDLPPGTGGGYLWRINAYWRLEERDGGTYLQCESISLTRDIPAGLGWLIGPFVNSIPRESLQFTLDATRKALTEK